MYNYFSLGYHSNDMDQINHFCFLLFILLLCDLCCDLSLTLCDLDIWPSVSVSVRGITVSTSTWVRTTWKTTETSRWMDQRLTLSIWTLMQVNSLDFDISHIQEILFDVCNIKPGDMGGNEQETRNTVAFIGSLIMDWNQI